MANEPTDKRQAIADAAFNLFISRAYHEVKLEEIAQIAGVAKGSIYTYFKSKDELFLEITNDAIETGEKQALIIVNMQDTFNNKLTRLITSHLQFASGAGQMLRAAMESLPKLALSEEVFQHFKERRQDFISILARLFEQGITEKCIGSTLNSRQLAALFDNIFKMNHVFKIFGETPLTEKQIFEILSGILQLS